MKSRLRHFILGIAIGIISVVMMRLLLNSFPGYENDSNLLVTVFVVVADGVGTAILGETLMVFVRKEK